VQILSKIQWLIRKLFNQMSQGFCIPNVCSLKFVTEIKVVEERGLPSRGRLLSIRQTNFKQETFQKIKIYVSQGNDFISPIQKYMTLTFTIGLMDSNEVRAREATSFWM
jgi:hypothetical protein